MWLQTPNLLNSWARVHSCPWACNYANAITTGAVQGLPLLSCILQLFPDWLDRWEKWRRPSEVVVYTALPQCSHCVVHCMETLTFQIPRTENLLSIVSAWSDLILSRYDSQVELSKWGKFANRVSLTSARTESWWYMGIRRGWDVDPTYTFNLFEIFSVPRELKKVKPPGNTLLSSSTGGAVMTSSGFWMSGSRFWMSGSGFWMSGSRLCHNIWACKMTRPLMKCPHLEKA